MGGWDYRSESGQATRGDRDVVLRHERRVLAFTNYAVAFHLAVEPAGASKVEESSDGGSDLLRDERALESYERDMLLYAYRHVAPLQTHALRSNVPAAVRFPTELVFESEGSPIRLECTGASVDGRVRPVTIAASTTAFGSNPVVVATLVLRPVHDRDSELNEYDLIKLAKLWEGGERLPEPGSGGEARGPVSFEVDGARVGFAKFADGILDEWTFLDYQSVELGAAVGRGESRTIRSGRSEPENDPSFTRHYRIGTIALKLPPEEENAQLLLDAKAVQELSDDAPELETPRWERVRALGGVLQGLLDFEDIGPAELSDVFADASIDEESLLAFHKGTLLTLTLEGSEEEEQRDAKLAQAIGMSPYLVVPRAVQLYNEQRLKSALIDTNELLSRQGRGDRPIGFDRRRSSIDETESGIREIERARAQHLPNVFHYRSERELYERGSSSAGFTDFEPLLDSTLDELKRKLDIRLRRRDRLTLGVTVTFFGIAALQLALTQVTKSVAWWTYLIVLVVLAVLVWRFRKRLF